ncbi:MAG: histidinol-phosphatase HisJ family protein [Erysipelotrichaceae bacterium]
MIADYHIHSNFSIDSKELMENYCLRALELNIDEICFSEHIDHGIEDCNNPGQYQVTNLPKYFKKIKELQQKYQGKLIIKIGIEFGAQLHNLELFRKDFYNYDFDFVLLSVHQIDNKELWINQYQNGKSQAQYNEGYYSYLLELVKSYDEYNCLAHLDLIRRYDKEGEYHSEQCYKIIKEILKIVIAKGKGIELNTSSFHYKLADFMPDLRIWQMYKELGGEIITIGSDSHKAERLADHFEVGFKMLKQIGFTHYSTFKKGKVTQNLIP